MISNFKKLFSFSKKEIDSAFKDAKIKKQDLGLKLLQAKQENLDFGKLLIIIPARTGKAHDRNLIKRRIKAIFYEHKLYQKPIISIIFVYKPALNLTFEQLKDFLVQNV
ncbi:ribonuclease P protein component [Candidatus Babeliales bacterium]|nr:ribonuclease P protein component [Candidatus Babeliales bacterium]